MEREYNFGWFKKKIIPSINTDYQVIHRYYPEGDFGSLNQVSIESDKIGCEIDFWSSGRISIYVWDYKEEKVLFNKLLFPEQEIEKKTVLEDLLRIL